MAYWEWKPSYELGITTIDNQHKKLVYYINELCSAIATKERARVASILNGIVEHTTLHFALEERLMSEAGYEMLESHKKAHEAFAAAINKYKTSFD
jgi:hemerythrin